MSSRLRAARLAALATLVAVPLLAGAQDGTGEDAALFEFDGRRWSADDLSARMQQLYGAVLADHHRALRTLVDEMLFDLHVEREARATGRDVQTLGRELLAVPEPAPAEVRAFYDNNRAAIGQPYELVHEQIARHLQRQATLERRDAIIARLKAEGGFRLLIAPPEPPPLVIDTRGRPVRGDPSAPVTLVEFSDFQCPNCKRSVKVMELLFEQHPDAFKLVHMDFPINASGVSRRVAMGGVCAQDQGRFWQYKQLAFTRQEALDDASPQALATELGLDMQRFGQCMRDPATRGKVQASEREGKRLGVTATPTLFVDGRPFPSSHLLRDLGEYIESKTAKQGS